MPIATMDTSINSKVYTGKEGSGKKHLGQRVVKDLTQHLKGKHHHVFVDNFFTSEELLRDLAKDDVYACGTARKDRTGFPPALKTAKLKNRSAHSKYTYVSVHACVCECMWVCTDVCACIRVIYYKLFECVYCLHMHMHTCTYMCKQYIRTCMHTIKCDRI